MRFNGLTQGFFIFVLALVTFAFFDVLFPYFSSILWAVILTIIFNPIKNKLRTFIGICNGLASILTIGIICMIVFIPMMIIISSLAIELNVVYTKLQQNNTQLSEVIVTIFNSLPDWVKSFIVDHNLINAAQFQKKLSDIAVQCGQYLAGSAFLIGKGTLGFAINFSIMFYLLFFFLKDGAFLVRQVLNSLPLSSFTKQHLFSKFVGVLQATVKGTVVVAVVQGTLGGIALTIARIEGSVLWGALIAFLSLIPAVGPAIVWIPAAIYLFATHQLWYALFIIGFFVIIVGLVDNLLRPLLVGKDTKMPDYLILISTLGGMDLYGINGFVIGPLIAALFIACWNLFSSHDYADKAEDINAVSFIKKKENYPDL